MHSKLWDPDHDDIPKVTLKEHIFCQMAPILRLILYLDTFLRPLIFFRIFHLAVFFFWWKNHLLKTGIKFRKKSHFEKPGSHFKEQIPIWQKKCPFNVSVNEWVEWVGKIGKWWLIEMLIPTKVWIQKRTGKAIHIFYFSYPIHATIPALI